MALTRFLRDNGALTQQVAEHQRYSSSRKVRPCRIESKCISSARNTTHGNVLGCEIITRSCTLEM